MSGIAFGNPPLNNLEKFRDFIENYLIHYNLSDIRQIHYIIIFIFQYYNYESVIVDKNNNLINIYIGNKMFALDLNNNVLYTSNILTDDKVVIVNNLHDILGFVLGDMYFDK